MTTAESDPLPLSAHRMADALERIADALVDALRPAGPTVDELMHRPAAAPEASAGTGTGPVLIYAANHRDWINACVRRDLNPRHTQTVRLIPVGGRYLGYLPGTRFVITKQAAALRHTLNVAQAAQSAGYIVEHDE